MVSDIDLQKLSEMFPLKKGVKLGGFLSVDLESQFKVDDLKKSDFGKIAATGKVKAQKLYMRSQSDSLLFKIEKMVLDLGQLQNSTVLTREKTNVFGGKVDAFEVSFSLKNQMDFSVKDLYAGFGSTEQRDTTQVATIKSILKLTDFRFHLCDTLTSRVRKATASILVNPSKLDKKRPIIHTKVEIDTVHLAVNERFLKINKGDYQFNLTQDQTKKWSAAGVLSFDSLYAYTSDFPLMIKMPKTEIVI